MATTDHIKFGDGLTVTDEGGGVIRVDGAGAVGPAGPQGPQGDPGATGPQGPAGPAPPLVTSLPGSPVDGQEVYYQADAAKSTIWHLRYRAASTSTYKWEFVGGPPLYLAADTTTTVSSGAVTDGDNPGPAITVPLAGIYNLEESAGVVFANTAGVDVGLYYKIGAAAAVQSLQYRSQAANIYGFVAGLEQITVTAAATVVKLQYGVSAGATTWARRRLKLTPVAVG